MTHYRSFAKVGSGACFRQVVALLLSATIDIRWNAVKPMAHWETPGEFETQPWRTLPPAVTDPRTSPQFAEQPTETEPPTLSQFTEPPALTFPPTVPAETEQSVVRCSISPSITRISTTPESVPSCRSPSITTTPLTMLTLRPEKVRPSIEKSPLAFFLMGLVTGALIQLSGH